jgi:hypothetical protein
LWHDKISQAELASELGKSTRTVRRWAKAGHLPRDPVTGRIVRDKAERTFAPYVIASRLRETLGQLSPASTAAVLIETLSADYVGALFHVLNGSSGERG